MGTNEEAIVVVTSLELPDWRTASFAESANLASEASKSIVVVWSEEDAKSAIQYLSPDNPLSESVVACFYKHDVHWQPPRGAACQFRSVSESDELKSLLQSAASMSTRSLQPIQEEMNEFANEENGWQRILIDHLRPLTESVQGHKQPDRSFVGRDFEMVAAHLTHAMEVLAQSEDVDDEAVFWCELCQLYAILIGWACQVTATTRKIKLQSPYAIEQFRLKPRIPPCVIVACLLPAYLSAPDKVKLHDNNRITFNCDPIRVIKSLPMQVKYPNDGTTQVVPLDEADLQAKWEAFLRKHEIEINGDGYILRLETAA